MVFAQQLDGLREVFSGNLPIAVGGAVAVVVLTTLFFMNRKRTRPTFDESVLASAPSSHPSHNPDEKALNWEPPAHSYADRRGAVRREGPPVRVLLSSSVFRNGVNDGFVLDRSTGGLRIAMPTAMAPGSTMQIRAVNAPDTIGFVTVIIRSCRKNGDFYEVGCEFEKTPPWNVLLLFG